MEEIGNKGNERRWNYFPKKSVTFIINFNLKANNSGFALKNPIRYKVYIKKYRK